MLVCEFVGNPTLRFFKIGLQRRSLPLVAVFVLFCIHIHTAAGQNTVKGSLLVQLKPATQPRYLTARLERAPDAAGWTLLGKVSDMLNVWQFANTASTPQQDARILAWLSRQPEVLTAQFDHLLESRGGPVNSLWPNDSLIHQQWQYANTGQMNGLPGADLSAEAAWNITTGGLTPAGDTIVAAVIDGGVAFHPDLNGNWRLNWQEIPGDGLDNDGNGYVDDFRGWNVYQQNDSIAGISTTHGTPIAGIIGAKGNNSQGVAGVNWNVKNLFVAGKGQESVALAAFDYVWKARRRYNLTNGAEGAFIVALNCSWGVNYGQPAEAPLWCAAFDSLGAAGILTIAATANLDVDVDQVGDLPTACPSEYLVAVTSLDNKDQKAQGAAWGAQSIDLGAYGEMVYTLAGASGYGYQEGTSFAAPHVTGAVALLYAAPCENLATLAKSNPAVAARQVKKMLLEHTRPNASMAGITQSGGRLDLYELLSVYEEECTDCPTPYAPSAEVLGTDSVRLSWTSVPAMQSVNLRWRPLGAAIWNLSIGVTAPLVLSGLTACGAYEFSLRANCGGALGSAWTEPLVFRTEGCCVPPAFVQVKNVTEQTALLGWPAVGAASQYVFQIRVGGTDEWASFMQDTNLIVIPGLNPCVLYETRVQSRCDTGFTDFSPSMFFRTAGCGACLDLVYCEAAAEKALEEWIASVAIGNWQHNSGGQTGYEDFTASAGAVLTVAPGEVVPVTLTPGFAGWAYNEFFRVYIDFNGDGDFEDQQELAFDPGFATSGPVYGNIGIPDFAAHGWVRMRVMMKFKGVFTSPPGPCEIYEFGQVEDYCLEIRPPLAQKQADGDAFYNMTIFPQPASDRASLQLPADDQGAVLVSVLDARGALVATHTMEHRGSALLTLPVGQLQTGMYVVRVENAQHQFRQKMLILR